MQQAPFEQNIIAMVWDCDKTLISSYMQEPLFRHFGVDGRTFWAEVNALKARYAAQGISVNSDTSYLNHILTYVKAGLFKGLSNKLLREFGKELSRERHRALCGRYFRVRVYRGRAAARFFGYARW